MEEPLYNKQLVTIQQNNTSELEYNHNRSVFINLVICTKSKLNNPTVTVCAYSNNTDYVDSIESVRRKNKLWRISYLLFDNERNNLLLNFPEMSEIAGIFKIVDFSGNSLDKNLQYKIFSHENLNQLLEFSYIIFVHLKMDIWSGARRVLGVFFAETLQLFMCSNKVVKFYEYLIKPLSNTKVSQIKFNNDLTSLRNVCFNPN